jgi:hypothetical protein
MRFLLVIFTFLSAICLVTAHTITIPAHVKECFFEELQVDDKMTITFQVGDGGQLDIDFWVSIIFFLNTRQNILCIEN